ncbi:MAG: gamma-glutamyl-gamma-aminobutyrate hydrolase family protein [Chloroflexota bacterium]|mgnify:CR=1 FL=1|nr:gamma-glutamyl-gamma-aminobutyrate hydrolase family protein [Chloroflexota bacterium]
MRPLIGIVTSSHTSETGNPYNRIYAMPALDLADAGGLPVYIPTRLDEDTLRGLYERLDAVLLPGGADVRPSLYGVTEVHPTTYGIDDERDKTEITLARWAVKDDRPLFGICRGHQVVNVALGGTLLQDIPSQVSNPLAHDIPDGDPRSTLLHDVRIDPSSKLAAILGVTQIKVNSLHHQAVEAPAPGVRVTALSPDEIVEALEIADRRFALTVQWHPEDMYNGDYPEREPMRKLFAAFVAAAQEHAERR